VSGNEVALRPGGLAAGKRKEIKWLKITMILKTRPTSYPKMTLGGFSGKPAKDAREQGDLSKLNLQTP